MLKGMSKIRTDWVIACLVTMTLAFIGGCTNRNVSNDNSFIVIDEPIKASLQIDLQTTQSVPTDTVQNLKAVAVLPPLMPVKAEVIRQEEKNDLPSQMQIVRIRAVGDLMMHARQLKSAKTDEGFDFTSYFGLISSELKGADITIGNLEAPIGTDHFSGYPRFNAPAEYVKIIKEAGFDAVTLANNHIFDNGIAGLLSTTEQLRAQGLLYAGAGTAQELSTPLIIERNGLKIALLAYAQATNLRPKNAENHINLLKKEVIELDVQRARQNGADFILAYVHWGSEYTSKPSPYQKQWAQTLADAGVDAILGSHPHVLQPIATVAASDERAVFCAYSLGNFMSNQPDFPRYIGAIVELIIVKDPVTGKCVLKQSGFIPTWICRYTKKGRSEYQVLRSNQPVLFEDEKLKIWANKRAQGALQHAVKVLGENGARMID